MELKNEFYYEFLSELSSVDQFLARQDQQRGYIEPADPDVQRLLEAMSFFAARTRQMTVENFDASVHRLVRGHLDELLTTQPTRSLIQAIPNDRLVESVYLPRGSEVRLVAADSTVGRFSTMHGLMLWPLTLERARIDLRRGGGFRLLIELGARVPQRTLGAPLRLYINYLNDYGLSSQLWLSLRQHAQRAAASFDLPLAEAAQAEGEPAELSFGAPAQLETEPHPHPLSDIRTFFHFPQIDNFVEIRVPGRDQAWKRLWITIDLDSDWPSDLVLNRDAFRLFVVPIENLRIDAADPIVHDGTQSQIPIRAPAPHPEDVLHSVCGVYEETATGTQPIPPAHLATGTKSYEVESFGSDPETAEHYLRLKIPGAFETPRKIAVEARWSQPWFEAHAVGRVRAALQTRSIEGVRWQTLGKLAPQRHSTLWGQPFDQLELLSLRSKPVLTRNELMRLMAVLGANDHSAFRGIDELITDVRVTEEATEGPGATIGYVYEVTVKRFEERRRAAVFHYLSRLWSFLATWSTTPARLDVRSEDDQVKLLTSEPSQ